MDLNSAIEIIKLIAGGGFTALVMLFIYRQKRISEERDRLLNEQKLAKLKQDEKELSNSVDSMPLDELVKSGASHTPKKDN